MSFARVSALRGALRASRASVARPQVFQQFTRRAYSEGHAHKEAGSDLPWLFGAIGVTVPGLYFILGQDSGAAHGHDDHSDSHAESHKEEESKDEPEEKSEEPEAKEEPKEEKSDDSESKDDKPAESKSEGADDGESKEKAPADKPAASKPAAEAPGTGPSQSSKQEGLSNTDTKHSEDLSSNPEKSKKPEGVVDTAKVKGTVDSNRGQSESDAE